MTPLSFGSETVKEPANIVMFFHGGGYIAPILPTHFDWCWHTYVLCGVERGIEVAVAILQHTLAPKGRFPAQLCETASALRQLLDAGINTSDIVIGGDSAGGNLVMPVQAHSASSPKSLTRRT